MSELKASWDAFVAQNPTAGIIVLLVALFVAACLAGLLLGAAGHALWLAFTRVYKRATGRRYVFTARRARVVSSILGAVAVVCFAFEVYKAVQSGVVTVEPRHAQAHTYYWASNRADFIVAIFEGALPLFTLWAVISGLLFRAAKASNKTEPAPPLIPPTQTSPQ